MQVTFSTGAADKPQCDRAVCFNYIKATPTPCLSLFSNTFTLYEMSEKRLCPTNMVLHTAYKSRFIKFN